MMKQTYSAPLVRVVDMDLDLNFCVSDTFSCSLEDTYDDNFDF